MTTCSCVEGKTFIPEESATKAIIALPGVTAVSEVLEENVLLLYDEKQHLATIKGVDESFVDVSGLDSMIYDGEMKLKDANRPYAVVGQGVAYSLRIGLNFIDPLLYIPLTEKQKSMITQMKEYWPDTMLRFSIKEETFLKNNKREMLNEYLKNFLAGEISPAYY